MGNSSSRHKQKSKSSKNNKHQQYTQQHFPGYYSEPPPPSTTVLGSDYRKPEPEPAASQGYYYNEQDTIGKESAIVTDQQQPTHADIDSCIERLLYVGQNKGAIGRTVCISQNEIIAICRYAYDLFLSQPVSFLFFFVLCGIIKFLGKNIVDQLINFTFCYRLYSN